MLGSQVSIPDGHLNRLVTHQFLNRAEVNPGHDQPARKCVTKAMPSEILQFCVLYHSIEPESWRMKTGAIAVEEHIRISVLTCLRGSQRCNRGIVKRNVPRLSVLAAG